jgi:hypothetical protein
LVSVDDFLSFSFFFFTFNPFYHGVSLVGKWNGVWNAKRNDFLPLSIIDRILENRIDRIPKTLLHR